MEFQKKGALPYGIQNLLSQMYAGPEKGFSGPQIVGFFSQFRLDVESYPQSGSPSRKQMFENELAKFSLEEQKTIISDLLEYDGPMKYERPSSTEISKVREWLGDSPILSTNFQLVNETPSWVYVHREWKKALDRVRTDPSAAITSARTLLESVCKHILSEKGIAPENDGDLQKLYRVTARALTLSPDQQAEDIFRQVLSGCSTVANGLAAMRNQFGDAHGHSKEDAEAHIRHARLAVNAACTIALFFVETYLADV